MKGYIEVKGNALIGWSNNAKTRSLDGYTKKLKVDFDNVVIPDGITHIQASPFDNLLCDVRKLTMPRSIKSISRGFFRNITNSAELYYSGTLEEWGQIKKPRGIEYSITCGYVIHCTDYTMDYR